MQRDVLKKAGVAALILLAPGGFVLAATLMAKHYRSKADQPPQGSGEP